MAFSAGNEGIRSGINVTPMIDVLLVLLILFMVIVPATPHGLESEIPQGSAEGARREAALPAVRMEVLDVAGGALYRVNGTSGSLGEVEARLRALLARRRDPVVTVEAPAGMLFGPVAKGVAVCRKAGAAHVVLASAVR